MTMTDPRLRVRLRFRPIVEAILTYWISRKSKCDRIVIEVLPTLEKCRFQVSAVRSRSLYPRVEPVIHRKLTSAPSFATHRSTRTVTQALAPLRVSRPIGGGEDGLAEAFEDGRHAVEAFAAGVHPREHRVELVGDALLLVYRWRGSLKA